MSRSTSSANPNPLTLRPPFTHFASALQGPAKGAWAYPGRERNHVATIADEFCGRFGDERPHGVTLGAFPLRVAARDMPDPSHDSLAACELTTAADDIRGNREHGTLLGYVEEPRVPPIRDARNGMSWQYTA